MVGEEKKYIRTWEELVMDRIGQAFHAKDQEDGDLLDSNLDEIEMLMKLLPAMYNELQAVKAHKQSLVKEGLKKAEQKSKTCPDDITREFVYRKEVYTLEWAYRTDMLEAVITVMGSYQKIPFGQPELASMETVIEPPAPKQEEVKPMSPQPQITIEGDQIEKTPKFKEVNVEEKNE